MHNSSSRASESAALRAGLRRTGEAGLGCRPDLCVHYAVCGGTQAAWEFNCFSCQGPRCTTCDLTCPYAKGFVGRMLDIGGLVFNGLAIDLHQPRLVLPEYVPVILHKSRRIIPLRVPVAAIPLYKVFHMVNGEYRTVADSPQELREQFLLHPGTQIVLRGVDQDRPIEKFWRYRRRDQVAQQLSRLGVTAVIAPNFSQFLDVPMTHNLYNRKRQLICIKEFVDAGLTVIPHLNAAHPADWRFWLDYLRANPGLRTVAIEFQTGNKPLARGLEIVNRLRRLRDQLGREIQPILVGGSRFAPAAAQSFGALSVMDARPFWNAMHRRCFDARRGSWPLSPTMKWAMLDEYLSGNIKDYARWVEHRIRVARSAGGAMVA